MITGIHHLSNKSVDEKQNIMNLCSVLLLVLTISSRFAQLVLFSDPLNNREISLKSFIVMVTDNPYFSSMHCGC